MDNTGLSRVSTLDLAQKLYEACITGNAKEASVFAAVLALREGGDQAIRKVFATNCTTSGRSERGFPRVRD